MVSKRVHQYSLYQTCIKHVTITYHLGCNFFRDKDGNLCFVPKCHVDKMLKIYECTFGTKPKAIPQSPLEKEDHPEIDQSELLDIDRIQVYPSLIGTLQWGVTLGRIDITTVVMTLSGFRAAPHQGHLDWVKQVFGYHAKFKDPVICTRMEEPDFSDLPDKVFD